MKIVISAVGKETIRDILKNLALIFHLVVVGVVVFVWFVGMISILHSIITYQTLFTGEQQETFIIFSHNVALFTLGVLCGYVIHRVYKFVKEHIKIIRGLKMSEGTFKSGNMYSAYKKELKMSEGKFKVGDWVTVSTTRKTEQVLDVDSNFVYTKTSYYKINLCELWKPQEGEYCFNEFNGLVKILKTLDTHLVSATAYNPFIQKECIVVLCQCEPFIGELPSFLK